MKKIIFFLFDYLFLIPLVISAFVMKAFRRIGSNRLRKCKNVLIRIGVFPIRDHYYEPFFNPKYLSFPLKQKRKLPGVFWNVNDQLDLLNNLNYSSELKLWVNKGVFSHDFYINNGSFEAGDAELWYSFIRFFKPKVVIEIGSGQSTIIATQAFEQNKKEINGYYYNHICIEPYEQKWLETLPVKVLRQKVEDLDLSIFQELKFGDILFIDSSHMIRPQGDVLKEYLEILPTLNVGVIIHIHDIFTPRDYPENSIINHVSFWNEQYLLEAFLTNNKNFKILSMANFLKNDYFDNLLKVCPYLSLECEPGSFYIQKIA